MARVRPFRMNLSEEEFEILYESLDIAANYFAGVNMTKYHVTKDLKEQILEAEKSYLERKYPR